MPNFRLAYTKTPASQPASKGMLPASYPSNYGNATSKVVSLNGTWKTDSISFTVDPLYRYTVHVRNSASIGATSINIDFIEVYGEASASYLTCSEDNGGYRYGFGNQEKENDISGVDGGHLTYEYRIHDARLGRFLSVDPLQREFPWNSSYAFAENRVIDGIDLEGLEHIYYNVLLDNKGNIIKKTRVDEWSRNITDKGHKGWGIQFNYYNKEKGYLYSAFQETPAPFFKGFPEGKIYILGREVFDDGLLQGNADGANSGEINWRDAGGVSCFIKDIALSGGNPLAVVLAFNSLTSDNVSKKLNDKSGNSSILSYAINVNMGLEKDNVFGKNVVSALNLINTIKDVKKISKEMEGQFGEDVWEYTKIIIDGVQSGKDVYDIFKGNHQKNEKPTSDSNE